MSNAHFISPPFYNNAITTFQEHSWRTLFSVGDHMGGFTFFTHTKKVALSLQRTRWNP